jgi:hypothetical protein
LIGPSGAARPTKPSRLVQRFREVGIVYITLYLSG